MKEQRLIDANGLLEKLDIDEASIKSFLSVLKSTDLNHGYDIFVSTIQIGEIDRFKDMVEEAPTVERPRGEWGNYEPYSNGYRCSHCKLIHRTCTRFCPNCGSYN